MSEYVYGFLHLQRCKQCELVFDRRVPTATELKDHYTTYSYNYLKKCPDPTLRSFNRLLLNFERFRLNGRILDIGCGQGDFLTEATKRKWQSYGTEYSTSAIQLSEKRGITIISEPANYEDFNGLTFDVITCFEVIEHIQSQCILFDLVYKLLRPGGLFYVTTPNFNSLLRFFEKKNFKMISYPEHLCFYTKYSLKYLAVTHGFTVNVVTTTGIDVSRLKTQLWRISGRKTKRPQDMIVQSENDGLRDRIDSNKILLLTKAAANLLLGWTGTGDTLKGWFLKP